MEHDLGASSFASTGGSVFPLLPHVQPKNGKFWAIFFMAQVLTGRIQAVDATLFQVGIHLPQSSLLMCSSDLAALGMDHGFNEFMKNLYSLLRCGSEVLVNTEQLFVAR